MTKCPNCGGTVKPAEIYDFDNDEVYNVGYYCPSCDWEDTDLTPAKNATKC